MVIERPETVTISVEEYEKLLTFKKIVESSVAKSVRSMILTE